MIFRFRTIKMERLRQQIDAIARFLEPNAAFINCHMVDYLTEQHWNRYVPKPIQRELSTVEDYLRAKRVFWGQFDQPSGGAIDDELPAVKAFIEETRKYRLEGSEVQGTALTLAEFQNALEKCRKETRLKMTELMNVKKCHEVEIAAAVVASLCTAVASGLPNGTPDDILVIDAGDGKGYLSSRIAVEHGIKVLGVDCNEENTSNAEKRRDRLKTKIPKAVKRANLEEDEHFTNLLKDDTLETLYRTTTQLIDFETDLIELAKHHFPADNHSTFCLCGLHTCGNLGPNCLRLFHQNRTIAGICNVGCCYHLMREEFVMDDFYNPAKISDNPGYGFPMSAYLRNRQFAIGRNARNLASESIERACINRENPSDKLGYRALLQVVLLQYGQKKSLQVGRLKSGAFIDYVRKSVRRLGLEDRVTISDESLLELEARFTPELEQLKVFYLIRQQFAPVVETLILLDRLLFLRESGYERSFLVKLFEPVVSPRCYALIAMK
ncbi:probable methyltransferase-like protein 25 [Anopheles aquasalis]|uniref:probable methyltransferase-like protein 25 n=1 Tax=Anopheles aquasalis TaxID=42839 RepID=UPI00215B29AE|nr:probable methyltransferase-like protein 25 [Anopheles aquasalis]